MIDYPVELVDELIADETAPAHVAPEAGWIEYLGHTLSEVLQDLHGGTPPGMCAEDLAYYLSHGDRAVALELGYDDLVPACRDWYAARRARLIAALREELSYR